MLQIQNSGQCNHGVILKMSTVLPIISEKPSPVAPDGDLIERLLAEQQSLTAVESFSKSHDSDASTTPAQSRYYTKLLPATPPGPGQQYSFQVDLDQCSGCKACVVACHTMNGLEEDESWRRVGTLTIGEPAEAARIQHVTTACHHCEDPGCLNGCPVKAYDKDPQTGIVRHLDDQCIGCKYCMMMCPYEVPKYSDRLGVVRKCDMCHQRLSQGEAPACVQSCPNEAIAISVVNIGESIDPESKLAAGAPLSSLTKPTTVFQSNDVDIVSGATPQDDQVDEVAESHWPLAIMLVATQASVGILLAERFAAAITMMVGTDVSELAPRFSATVALLIAGVGMAIAPLHLGQPLRAWRVFLGLRTSWLSREAVVLGKYMGLLCAAVGLLWLPVLGDAVPASVSQLIPDWAASATLGMTIIVGIVGLVCSAMIYVATQRRLWRVSRTFTRFIGSAVVAGSAWTVVTMCFSGASMVVTTSYVFATIAALVAKLAWEQKIQTASLAGFDEFDIRSARMFTGALESTADFRRDFAMAGIGLLGVAWLIAFSAPTVAAGIAALAATAICGGEFVERVLYFQSVVYDRMPGTLT